MKGASNTGTSTIRLGQSIPLWRGQQIYGWGKPGIAVDAAGQVFCERHKQKTDLVQGTRHQGADGA